MPIGSTQSFVCADKIFDRERGAMLLRECGHLLGELARVERLAFRFGDALERFRLRGKRELFAGLRVRGRAA